MQQEYFLHTDCIQELSSLFAFPTIIQLSSTNKNYASFVFEIKHYDTIYYPSIHKFHHLQTIHFVNPNHVSSLYKMISLRDLYISNLNNLILTDLIHLTKIHAENISLKDILMLTNLKSIKSNAINMNFHLLNNFKKLESVHGLKKVDNLSLSYIITRLKSLDINSIIPIDIQNNSKLTKVSVSANIRSYSNFNVQNCLNIEKISIAWMNQVDIKNNSSLTFLEIDRSISMQVQKCISIRMLKLYLESDAEKIDSILNPLQNLESFHLSYNPHWGKIKTICFPSSFTKLTQLKLVNVNVNLKKVETLFHTLKSLNVWNSMFVSEHSKNNSNDIILFKNLERLKIKYDTPDKSFNDWILFNPLTKLEIDDFLKVSSDSKRKLNKLSTLKYLRITNCISWNALPKLINLQTLKIDMDGDLDMVEKILDIINVFDHLTTLNVMKTDEYYGFEIEPSDLQKSNLKSLIHLKKFKTDCIFNCLSCFSYLTQLYYDFSNSSRKDKQNLFRFTKLRKLFLSGSSNSFGGKFEPSKIRERLKQLNHFEHSVW